MFFKIGTNASSELNLSIHILRRSDIKTEYIMKAVFRKTNSKYLEYTVKIIALAIVYHLAARVGLMTAYVQTNTSPVWPPTGIALAALLHIL